MLNVLTLIYLNKLLYLQNRLARGEKPRAKGLCIPVLAQATNLGLQGLLPSMSPEMALLQGSLLMLEHTEAEVKKKKSQKHISQIYLQLHSDSFATPVSPTSINCYK